MCYPKNFMSRRIEMRNARLRLLPAALPRRAVPFVFARFKSRPRAAALRDTHARLGRLASPRSRSHRLVAIARSRARTALVGFTSGSRPLRPPGPCEISPRLAGLSSYARPWPPARPGSLCPPAPIPSLIHCCHLGLSLRPFPLSPARPPPRTRAPPHSKQHAAHPLTEIHTAHTPPSRA